MSKSKEIDDIKMLGDGVLVEKPVLNEKVGNLYIPEEMQQKLLPMHICKVVKVGGGSANEMEVEEGDTAYIVKGPEYAEVMFDNKTYYVLAQHNILFVKRNSKG